MCHNAMSLISKALDAVDNAEVLLKIKGVIALFIQTMDVGRFVPCTLARLTVQRAGDTQWLPWMHSF